MTPFAGAENQNSEVPGREESLLPFLHLGHLGGEPGLDHAAAVDLAQELHPEHPDFPSSTNSNSPMYPLSAITFRARPMSLEAGWMMHSELAYALRILYYGKGIGQWIQ